MDLIHWGPRLFVLVVVLLTSVIPAVFIVRKAGYSPWWSLLYGVPLVAQIAIWVFALAKWPTLKRPVARSVLSIVSVSERIPTPRRSRPSTVWMSCESDRARRSSFQTTMVSSGLANSRAA